MFLFFMESKISFNLSESQQTCVDENFFCLDKINDMSVKFLISVCTLFSVSYSASKRKSYKHEIFENRKKN